MNVHRPNETTACHKSRIADALVVCLTRGVSLKQWKEVGLLEREWALYAAIQPHYDRIVFLTDGDADDIEVGSACDPSLIVLPRSGEEEHSLLRRVCDALRGLNTVVVKSNQFDGSIRAAEVAQSLRRGGTKAGLLVRGGYLRSQFMSLQHGGTSNETRFATEEEARALAAADMVVGTTRSMIDLIEWRYGVARDRLAVIPNYVRTSNVRSPERSRTENMILCAGRLVEQKRVDLILRAVAEISQEATLHIVGTGPLEKDLRELATSLGVHASFRGRIDHVELRELMSRCAVFVQASAYEGHPKTVLEAMESGAPIVVTRSPGLADDVRHRESGIVVEESVPAIAKGIAELLANRSMAADIGAGAQQWIAKHRSLEVIVPQELEAHRRAISRAGMHAAPQQPIVHWPPALLNEDDDSIERAWESSLRGFVKRLTPPKRARFLASLDRPLYEMQGEAAAEADGGLHPKHRLMQYHDFFVERIAYGERVIDLGCGVGALAHAIASRSQADVTGIDWSQANLARAKNSASIRSNARFEHGDITQSRCEGSFDVVVLSNVLEHLADRPRLLRQWHQWYGARRFLIRVPAFDREWRVPWKRELGVEWRLDPTHETEYTLAQLESELALAGLEIVEVVARWGEYWVEARCGIEETMSAQEHSAA